MCTVLAIPFVQYKVQLQVRVLVFFVVFLVELHFFNNCLGKWKGNVSTREQVGSTVRYVQVWTILLVLSQPLELGSRDKRRGVVVIVLVFLRARNPATTIR